MAIKSAKRPCSRVRLKHKQDNFYSQVIALFQGIGAIVGFGITGSQLIRPGKLETLQVVGFIVLVPSIILWTVARIQLGRCCTLLPDARNLITTGLYSKFRNPVYIFGTTAMASYFLVFGSPLILFVLVIIIPIQFYRAKQEAVVLEQHFGNDYRKYVSTVWL